MKRISFDEAVEGLKRFDYSVEAVTVEENGKKRKRYDVYKDQIIDNADACPQLFYCNYTGTEVVHLYKRELEEEQLEFDEMEGLCNE